MIETLHEGSKTVIKARASSWGLLFDCAHSWEGPNILGITKAAGLRAHLGTSVHAATAAYDSSRLPGRTPIDELEAADVLRDALRNPDRDIDWEQDDLTPREALRIGTDLVGIYCADIAPRFNFTSVEMTLQPFDIDCGDGLIVRLTGSMDRARVSESAAGVVIPDVKTGTRVIEDGEASIKARSAQVGTYQLLYEKDPAGGPTVGGQIIALSTGSRPAGAVSRVWNAKRVMVGTPESPGLIEHAAAMFKTGLFPPNPQSRLCNPRFCARWSTCIYHE